MVPIKKSKLHLETYYRTSVNRDWNLIKNKTDEKR